MLHNLGLCRFCTDLSDTLSQVFQKGITYIGANARPYIRKFHGGLEEEEEKKKRKVTSRSTE